MEMPNGRLVFDDLRLGSRGPTGYVRDLRVRWALEEAGLPYRVNNSVPFGNRSAEHFAHLPFGQVPWLIDGDLSIFESGAILLLFARPRVHDLRLNGRCRAKIAGRTLGRMQ
jgi:glutathione S-transferase